MTVDAITRNPVLETKHGVLSGLERLSAINGKWGLLGTSRSVDHFWNWAAVLVFGLDQEPASHRAALELTLNHRGYLEARGKGWLMSMWANIGDLAVIASLDASYAQACLDYPGKNGVPGYFKKTYRPYLKLCAGKPVRLLDRMKLALALSQDDLNHSDQKMGLVLGVMTILHARKDRKLLGIANKLQDRLRARFGDSLGSALDRVDRNGPYRILCDMGYLFKWEHLLPSSQA